MKYLETALEVVGMVIAVKENPYCKMTRKVAGKNETGRLIVIFDNGAVIPFNSAEKSKHRLEDKAMAQDLVGKRFSVRLRTPDERRGSKKTKHYVWTESCGF